jgi:hypothetical protein
MKVARMLLLTLLTCRSHSHMAHGREVQVCPVRAANDATLVETSPLALPELGRWMIDATGLPAHWLGEIFEGKKLREPINVVIIDRSAATAEDAVTGVIEGSTRAGYPIRMGHSTGYRALIAGELHHQLPKGWDDAFSNHLFETTNNHGRIFGPSLQRQFYVFVGAFSREAVSLFHWPEHRYASFNKARDEFAASMDRHTKFKASGYLDMSNALLNEPDVSTGDHDGKAVILCAGT